MELFKILNEIKNIYAKGGNLIDYMKGKSKSTYNSVEQILISYDFQAGSYIKKAKKKPEFEEKWTNIIRKEINNYGDFGSLMEVGVGEATTLAGVVKNVEKEKQVFGFDISWSRIKYAKVHLAEKKIKDVNLFVGDLFNIPLLDNAIDIVYTAHTLEPNGGREEEAIRELYRVTNTYLLLFEPSTEFADEETKTYISKRGYVRNLVSTIKKLGYEIVKHELIFDKNYLSPNNTGLIVIKKEKSSSLKNATCFACPVTKTQLSLIRNNYYSQESLLLYPVIDDIACLLPNNAIVATHYLDNFND